MCEPEICRCAPVAVPVDDQTREEHLALLEDEVYFATDRLSRSEAKAVVHSVYNGDWLAARVAAAVKDAQAEALAPILALADHLGGYNPGHGDYATAARMIRAAVSAPGDPT